MLLIGFVLIAVLGSDDVLPLHPGCYPASTPLAYSCDMDDRG